MLSHNNSELECADYIAVTFEMQKKEEKNNTVHTQKTGDPIMCPVRAASELVRHIRSYPKTTDETPISAVLMGSRVRHVTSKQVAKALQDTVTAIGEDVLNIKAEEVETHSLRSAAAMAMFLGGLPVYLIMLMGRWSSNAFLRYICKIQND